MKDWGHTGRHSFNSAHNPIPPLVSIDQAHAPGASEDDVVCLECGLPDAILPDKSDMILCGPDRHPCSGAMHMICAGLSQVPQEDWWCPKCREIPPRASFPARIPGTRASANARPLQGKGKSRAKGNAESEAEGKPEAVNSSRTSGQPTTPPQIKGRKRKLDTYHNSLTRVPRARLMDFLLAKTRENAASAKASVKVGGQIMEMFQAFRTQIAGITAEVDVVRLRQDVTEKRLSRIRRTPRMRPPAPVPASHCSIVTPDQALVCEC